MHPDRPALVVHGHFYQPPRENPWTGAVDREPSAAPYENWNERIHAECYLPNAWARVVDQWGRVGRIVDNYARTSFNVGPTLMAWLERHHRRTHERIVEADRRSVSEHGGHGNAIAQAYNHAILPLMNARDRRTQVLWGLADFRRRFGREAEAIWLPETACDDATLEILVDAGMRFVILAPQQAQRVRPLGGGPDSWRDVSDGSVDPTQAYRWLSRDASGRSIALFFYDGPIARSIAFEGALSSSEGLVGRFAAASRGPGRIVHVATDGETYGHHFKFGDRCLAYALDVEAPARGFWRTNYGEFLDHFPPAMEAEIRPGPDGEGTSWSCAHGVGRWRRDCGCQTGGREGWSQAWREPLRGAFDLLRDGAAAVFDEAARDFFDDPWAARDAYVERVLEPSAPAARFLEAQAGRKLDAAARARALLLLESQRHAMLMYTSCGWFFNDLAGIETVQVLKYAGRLVEELKALGAGSPEEGLLDVLAQARSNRPGEGNGADLFRRTVAACRVAPQGVAAHLSFAKLVDHHPVSGDLAGYRFVLSRLSRHEEGRLKLATARVELEEVATTRRYDFATAAVHLGGVDFYCAVRGFPGNRAYDRMTDRLGDDWRSASLPAVLRRVAEDFGAEEFGVEQVLPEGRALLFETVFGDLDRGVSEQFGRLYDDNRRIIELLRKGGFELPPALRTAAEFALARRYEDEVLRQDGSTDPAAYAEAIAVAEQADRLGVTIRRRRVREAFEARVLSAVDEHVSDPGPRTAEAVATLLVLAETLGVSVGLERAQEALWPLVSAGGLTEEQRALATLLGFAV